MKRSFLVSAVLAVTAPLLAAGPASATVVTSEPTRPALTAKAVAKQSGVALAARVKTTGAAPKARHGNRLVANRASASSKVASTTYGRVGKKQFCVTVTPKHGKFTWAYDSLVGATVKMSSTSGFLGDSACAKWLDRSREAAAAENEALAVASVLPSPYPALLPARAAGVVSKRSTVAHYVRHEVDGEHQVRFCVVRASGAWAVHDSARGTVRSGWYNGRCVGATVKRA